MKRFHFLILILFYFCNTGYGQNEMDSLWTIWSNKNETEIKRITSLSLYSELYTNKNLDSSLFYAQKAYDLASKKELDTIRSFAKTIIGHSQFNKGDYNNAIKSYTEASEIAIENDFKNLEAVSYFSIGVIYRSQGDMETALNYYDKSVFTLNELNKTPNLSQKDLLKSKKYMADILNNRAIAHVLSNNQDLATKDFEESIELYKSSSDPTERSSAMLNFAILKRRQGDYSSAIDLYIKSLKINEELSNDILVGIIYRNIANVYIILGDYDNYYKNINKGLEISKGIGHKSGILSCLKNLAENELTQNNYEKSLAYCNEALPIAEELNEVQSIADILNIKSSIQISQQNLDQVFENIKKSKELFTSSNDQLGIIQSEKLLGDYFAAKKNYKEAINYYSTSLEKAKNTNLESTQDIALSLYQVYKNQGNEEKALKFYELFVKSKDSIVNEKNRKNIIQKKLKYEYDKKALADSLAFAAQQQIQETKLEKTQSDRRSLFIGLLVVLAFTIIVIARNRKINSQKETIENQNNELQDLNENLEEKVAERTKELKKSDERYTYALEASSDGIWDYNVQSDTIKFSPAIYTMLGFEPYEFPETRKALYKLLHSEDIKIAKRKSHELFLTKNSEEFLTDEYRLMGKDGTIVWVQVKGKIVERDENNNPVRIVGTHTNITKSKLRNQETLATILRTEDAERSRISKDIHDGLQQTLTISFLNFNGLKKHLIDFTEELKEKYNLGFEYLQKSISESREVAHTLMPKSIMDYGVLSACQRLVDDMNKSNEKTAFSFYHNLKSERLPNHQIEITLYRILQESLNNIVKYAHASNVDIQLKDYDDMYMLTVEDNGVGFDTEILQKEGKGLGFSSMKNRLDAINGYLEIDSEKGEGTTILVQIDKAA